MITVKIKGPVDEGELVKVAKELASDYEIEENKIKVSING